MFFATTAEATTSTSAAATTTTTTAAAADAQHPGISNKEKFGTKKNFVKKKFFGKRSSSEEKRGFGVTWLDASNGVFRRDDDDDDTFNDHFHLSCVYTVGDFDEQL